MNKANQVLETINKAINEADNVDPTLPFAVLINKGPLSIPQSGTYQYKGYKKIFKTFKTKQEADDYAKQMNASLSKGEKSYYKTNFTVVNARPQDYVKK